MKVRLFTIVAVAYAFVTLAVYGTDSGRSTAAPAGDDAPPRTVPAPAATAEPVLFRHDVSRPQRYRIVSVNDQEIFLDGQLARVAQIVTRVRIDQKPGDQVATVDAEFFLTESDRRFGEAVGVTDRYTSTFTRSHRGDMTIDERYIMPVVRDFPRFPEDAVSPGDEWFAPAWEVHDLSEGYGLTEPLVFEVVASYRYAGEEVWNGTSRHRIDVRYGIAHRERRGAAVYPATVTGESRQRLFWDEEAGRLAGVEEEYWIQFVLSTGQTILYEGTARTEVIDARPIDRPGTVRRLEEEVSRQGIRDVVIEEDDEGVSIVLEDIRFPPDSATLLPAERERLRRIGELLGEWGNHDILVTGHTALAGTAAGRQALSMERARVVGELLIAEGVRSPEAVLYRGVGAAEPRGDNATEEGRRRNRRVEITILEN
jgi:outer membrane protein OmpA-like peptidoglycan-associated protein